MTPNTYFEFLSNLKGKYFKKIENIYHILSYLISKILYFLND